MARRALGYQKYREMIAAVDGNQEDAKLPDGVTTKDFAHRGDANDWYGTIYCHNGIPQSISYYVWECSDENMAEGLSEQLAEFDGEWELYDFSGGNGHYHAKLRKVK